MPKIKCFMLKKSKILKKLAVAFTSLLVLGITSVFVINAYVKCATCDKILAFEDAVRLENIDCILVLGCGLKDNGMPSDMLNDRLTRSLELYDFGLSSKLLMSGDHGRKEYNEVGAMKKFAVDSGIPSEDIFMDHAGFSTYESIYRAKEIFEADKVIIVTQEYHLYRAIYIAEQLGIEAYGVASDYNTYMGQSARELREIVARCKDFAKAFFKPKPTYLGDVIPVSGNGDVTNDY